MALNAQMEFEILQVVGDTVTTRSRYWDDDVWALGIAYLEGIEEVTVQDGKVTADTWTYTDESLVQLQAALAALELPETGVGSPPSRTVPLGLEVGWLLLVALGLGMGLWRASSRAR